MMADEESQELREVAALLREAGQRLERLADAQPERGEVSSDRPPARPRPAAGRDGARLVESLMNLQHRRDAEQAMRAELQRRRAEHAMALERLEDATAQTTQLHSERDTAAQAEEDVEHIDRRLAEAEMRRQEAQETVRGAEAEILHSTDSLERRTTEIDAELEELRACARSLVLPAPALDGPVPVRVLVLRALQELSAPTPAALLGDYVQARYGREIRSNRWGALRRDELKSWESYRRRGKQRAAWLCPALDADTDEALTGLWTRSDWPLSLRVVLEGDQTLHRRRLYRLGLLALAPPPNTHDVDALQELVRMQFADYPASWHGHSLEEDIGSALLVVREELQVGRADVRAHDPDAGDPGLPDWFNEHVSLPDTEIGRLFGCGEELPF